MIDLPIAREKATGIPFLPGSSLKGILRDSCKDAAKKEKVFGLKVRVDNAQKVVLEDLDLTPTENQQAGAWAQAISSWVFPNANDAEWQRIMGERFCIVSDDVLSFLLNTATEITARIKLQEESKTVQKGGLWYEEALPTETILYGLFLATPNAKTGLREDEIFQVIAASIPSSVQLGGKATVGRGLCRVLLQNLQTQPQQPQNTPSATPPGSSKPKVTFGAPPVTKLS